jgi:hypothetical protein
LSQVRERCDRPRSPVSGFGPWRLLVARNNFNFEKRQREQKKERKKEEKRQRKLDRQSVDQVADGTQESGEDTEAEGDGEV